MMSAQQSARDCERAYPWIPWRTPLRVEIVDGASGYACRICVALHGLKAEDVGLLWETPEAVEAHTRASHRDRHATG